MIEVTAGDKGGCLGFWSLPPNIDGEKLPLLENGMRDISDVGEVWEFQISNKWYCVLMFIVGPFLGCTTDQTT